MKTSVSPRNSKSGTPRAITRSMQQKTLLGRVAEALIQGIESGEMIDWRACGWFAKCLARCLFLCIQPMSWSFLSTAEINHSFIHLSVLAQVGWCYRRYSGVRFMGEFTCHLLSTFKCSMSWVIHWCFHCCPQAYPRLRSALSWLCGLTWFLKLRADSAGCMSSRRIALLIGTAVGLIAIVAWVAEIDIVFQESAEEQKPNQKSLVLEGDSSE